MTTLLPTSQWDEATAQLGNDREVEVRVAPTPAGLRWVERGTTPDDAHVVESAGMRSYKTVSHGRGAAEGLLLGGLGGAAIGAAIGLASGDDRCDGDFCLFRLSARDKAVLGGLAFGSIGFALGGLIGALIGSRDVYELDSTRVPRMSATIAPGRAGGALSWSF